MEFPNVCSFSHTILAHKYVRNVVGGRSFPKNDILRHVSAAGSYFLFDEKKDFHFQPDTSAYK